MYVELSVHHSFSKLLIHRSRWFHYRFKANTWYFLSPTYNICGH